MSLQPHTNQILTRMQLSGSNFVIAAQEPFKQEKQAGIAPRIHEVIQNAVIKCITVC